MRLAVLNRRQYPRAVPKARSTIVASVLALALVILPITDAWSYTICVDSYAGSCLLSSSCTHYDSYDNVIGRVFIEYQC